MPLTNFLRFPPQNALDRYLIRSLKYLHVSQLILKCQIVEKEYLVELFETTQLNGNDF